MCYEKDQGPYYKKNQKPWVVDQAPDELPPRDDCQDTEQWLEDEEGLKQVDSALPMEGEPKSRTGKIQVHGVAEWGQLFRARIFMHAKRYRATVKCEGDANYWALIDMRFQQVENLVLWHTSLSVWSGPPWNTHHRPKSLQFKPKDSQAMSSTDADRLTLDFRHNSRKGFRNYSLKGQGVAPMELRVFDRLDEPPSFLVAVPRPLANNQAWRHRVSTWSDHLSNQPDVLRKMSYEVLFSQHYESHPWARLKGGVNVYRRFFRVAENDRPRYFLIPDTGTWAPDLNAWHLVQEEATAINVGILANLEAYAASQLRGIDTRVRILENHLEIYRGVAAQAGTLWDALARLLPDARGSFWGSSGLGEPHRWIELIHQTLLQGVEDLSRASPKHRRGTIPRSKPQPIRSPYCFDRELHHVSPEKGSALHDSLRGGYIDRLRRTVRKDAAAAVRVARKLSHCLGDYRASIRRA